MAKELGEAVSGSFDAIVIGAGIMGSCTAYELAKRGKTVLLLEQFDFLHHRGSSHGESRTIRITYPEDYYVEMMQESYRLWEEAEHEAGYVVSRRTGQLDFGPEDNPSLQAIIRAIEKAGIEHRILLPHQLAPEFGHVRIPKGWIAIHTAHGGVVRASKAVAMFQALALKHGAVLRDNATVQAVDPCWRLLGGGHGVQVRSSRGTAEAERVVIAAGSWTGKLVRELSGLTLPIQPLQTSILYWEIPDPATAEAMSAAGGFPVFASHGAPEFYGTPSLEYPGLIKVGLHGGSPCDPDHRRLVADAGQAMELVSPFVRTHFPGAVRADLPVLSEACMYSMTPDEDFILDWLPMGNAHESDSLGSMSRRVWVAAGFSGHGFKFGPVVGRIMADLALSGTADGVQLHRFSFRRFPPDASSGAAAAATTTATAAGNSKSFDRQVLAVARSDQDPMPFPFPVTSQ